MKLYKELPTVDTVLPADVDTTLRTEGPSGCETYTVQVHNTGANPLTGFGIYGLAGKNDAPYTLLQGQSFVDVETSGGAVVFWASSDPASLAAGDSCLLKIEMSDLSAIKLMAISVLGTTVRTTAGAYSYVANS
jgi:hypothetical protein